MIQPSQSSLVRWSVWSMASLYLLSPDDKEIAIITRRLLVPRTSLIGLCLGPPDDDLTDDWCGYGVPQIL